MTLPALVQASAAAKTVGPSQRHRIGFGLQLLVATMFLVPASITFAGLRTLGVPSQMAALVLTCALIARAIERRTAGERARMSPVRVVLLLLAAWFLVSFVYGYSRPLTSLESASSVRVLLLLMSAFGVCFYVSAVSRDEGRRIAMVTLLLLGAYFSAAVATVQFFFHWMYIDYLLLLPGATDTGTGELGLRTVTRALGTATHAIELSVVCGALVPLAIWRARAATASRGRHFHQTGTALLTFGALAGVSRSGVIALAVSVLLYVPRLPWRSVFRIGVSALLFLVLIQFGAQGLLSTLRYLFTHTSSTQDYSVAGRTEDYGAVSGLIGEQPIFGIGLGTYQKDVYRILDNQYLGTLVETGFIGASLLILALVSAVLGLVAFKRSAAEHELAWAMGGGIAGCAVPAAFFDLLSFRQVSFTLFILLGIGLSLLEAGRGRPISSAGRPTAGRGHLP